MIVLQGRCEYMVNEPQTLLLPHLYTTGLNYKLLLKDAGNPVIQFSYRCCF